MICIKQIAAKTLRHVVAVATFWCLAIETYRVIGCVFSWIIDLRIHVSVTHESDWRYPRDHIMRMGHTENRNSAAKPTIEICGPSDIAYPRRAEVVTELHIVAFSLQVKHCNCPHCCSERLAD